MNEWFLIESLHDGVWVPLSGSGSKTYERARRVMDDIMQMMPDTTTKYRVARYVRDEAAQ